jgi:hypothetical protein
VKKGGRIGVELANTADQSFVTLSLCSKSVLPKENPTGFVLNQIASDLAST